MDCFFFQALSGRVYVNLPEGIYVSEIQSQIVGSLLVHLCLFESYNLYILIMLGCASLVSDYCPMYSDPHIQQLDIYIFKQLDTYMYIVCIIYMYMYIYFYVIFIYCTFNHIFEVFFLGCPKPKWSQRGRSNHQN